MLRHVPAPATFAPRLGAPAEAPAEAAAAPILVPSARTSVCTTHGSVVAFAGATPKKQLILPALDTHSACSTFVDFTPPRARVPGPHVWDYERVHALLGTGEIAGHMKTFTGYAELLFVACAQSAAPGGPEPRRNREPPVKILVAVATTGWCWLLRGGLHVAPTPAGAGGCCASRPPRGPTRYSRSASSWCEQRATFSLLVTDATPSKET